MYRVRCRVKQYQTLSLSVIISENRDTLTPTQTYRPPRHTEREKYFYIKKKKKKKKKRRESKRVRSDISTVVVWVGKVMIIRILAVIMNFDRTCMSRVLLIASLAGFGKLFSITAVNFF